MECWDYFSDSLLGEVGAEIKASQDSTSQASKIAALSRATDDLKNLDEYVQNEVIVPEQFLLRRIIRQWQDLIIEAGGELGRAEVVGPVENPYVAGNPVGGDLFVGREDILRWMGKSSILHNSGARFGRDTEIVDFNMQRVGLVASTEELLYNLALALYDVLTPTLSQKGIFAEPEEERFLGHNPYTAFNRFMAQIERLRGERRFILAVDEFELSEEKIQQGKLEKELLDYWRSLIQSYPWFVMAFAGLHTLDEMTQDYWNPLFGSVTGISVSFLKEGAAESLITQPNADFNIDYDRDAIEEIIRLSHGQPYLLQLICHCLVTRFNRQMFEEGEERERRFHLDDVKTVIEAPEFFRDGNAYFSGVWGQAGNGESALQQTVLKSLAQSEEGMTMEELQQNSKLTEEELFQALNVLRRHDVVIEFESIWRFSVELMRRWVVKKMP